MGGSSCRAQPRGHQRDHGATKGTVDLSPPALPKDTRGFPEAACLHGCWRLQEGDENGLEAAAPSP